MIIPYVGNRVPGEIDAFADVYRVVYDWQSSRTRRAINSVLGTRQFGELPPIFSTHPRAAPLLDASAVLDWLTGKNTYMYSYQQLVEDQRLRNEKPEDGFQVEPVALFTGQDWPTPPPDYPDGPKDQCIFREDQVPVIRQLDFQKTREVMGYFEGLLEWLPRELVRQGIAADILPLRAHIENPANAADLPGYDVLPRLARFTTHGLSLRRQPGTIRVPWFHPFEFMVPSLRVQQPVRGLVLSPQGPGGRGRGGRRRAVRAPGPR